MRPGQRAAPGLRGCAGSGSPGVADRSRPNRTEPYLEAWLDGTWGDAGEPRGQGWWGPEDTDLRHVLGAGNSVLTGWSSDASALPAGGLWMQPATVEVCFERVRPDDVRGRVRATIVPEGRALIAGFYGYLVLSFPFDLFLPEHGGFDATLPDNGAAPDGYEQAHFVYGTSYDDAWPWDDITDAAVREVVYDRYTPYNAE